MATGHRKEIMLTEIKYDFVEISFELTLWEYSCGMFTYYASLPQSNFSLKQFFMKWHCFSLQQ